MRLHHLTLQAFGPYAEHEAVDFERLAGSGLFLLEGPTGAGKSSVLDAVTFALYGGLSSEQSAKDRLHSSFASPATTPTVTLEWSVRGRRLRITRVPAHQRPRRRGDGTTSQKAQVHLEELVDDQWRTRSHSLAETGELVTDLMGLNRSQFTQVVLLPQGEFARFLRAGDDDRRALLTKLFGTDLFERITADLDDRRAQAERARVQARGHVDQALSAAAGAAGLDAGSRQALVDLDDAARTSHLELITARLAEAEQQARVAADLAQTALTAVSERRDRARAHAEQVLAAVTAGEQLRAHELGREDQQRRRTELDAARRAEPVRPLLDRVTAAETEQQRARAALAAQLTGDDPLLDADERALAAAVTAATAAALAADAEAAGLGHPRELASGLPERRRQVSEQQQQLADLDDRLGRLAAESAGLPAAAARAEQALVAATSAATRRPALADRIAESSARLDAAVRLADTDLALAAQHQAYELAEADLAAAAEDHRELQRRRLAGMSAELAAGLEPGRPCPVCGSAAHPRPATGQDPVTEDEVAASAARRESAEAARTATGNELAGLRERRDALAERSGEHSVEALGRQLAQQRHELAGLDTAAARAEHLTEQVAQLRARRAGLDDERSAAGAARAAAAALLAEQRQRLAEDEAVVAAARGDHDSVEGRHRALSEHADDQHALAATLTTLLRCRGEQARAAQEAEQQARRRRFPDLDAARSAARSPEQVERLAVAVEHWAQELAALERAVAATAGTGVDTDLAAAAATALDEAVTELAAADADHRRADLARADTAKVARVWAEGLRALDQARLEQHRTRQATADVIRLAALAKGTGGQRRVALTTYVLRHWFGQVVAAANLRLAAMSGGRYELERSDEAAGRATRAGLTLTVIDRHTGRRRDPASLSGGETFFTSLALALGLAEVVSAEAGGVDLDTLFIDEGFGSLDSATLDQVMAVIDELRDRGRVVGIVSHVPDLLDRVPERLEVRRRADGSSFLQVVA